jgi:hypothetical protein
MRIFIRVQSRSGTLLQLKSCTKLVMLKMCSTSYTSYTVQVYIKFIKIENITNGKTLSDPENRKLKMCILITIYRYLDIFYYLGKVRTVNVSVAKGRLDLLLFNNIAFLYKKIYCALIEYGNYLTNFILLFPPHSFCIIQRRLIEKKHGIHC